MKKWILNWLFGTDNVKSYMKLLLEGMDSCKESKYLIDSHLETLRQSKEMTDIALKLIEICKKYGIDVDKEMDALK